MNKTNTSNPFTFLGYVIFMHPYVDHLIKEVRHRQRDPVSKARDDHAITIGARSNKILSRLLHHSFFFLTYCNQYLACGLTETGWNSERHILFQHCDQGDRLYPAALGIISFKVFIA